VEKWKMVKSRLENSPDAKAVNIHQYLKRQILLFVPVPIRAHSYNIENIISLDQLDQAVLATQYSWAYLVPRLPLPRAAAVRFAPAGKAAHAAGVANHLCKREGGGREDPGEEHETEQEEEVVSYQQMWTRSCATACTGEVGAKP
jgi:hypothetical protein